MNNLNNEEGISMKELIIALLKSWKLIIVITLIVSIIGGIYTFVIVKPTYESEVEGTILIPLTTETKYGFYTFPTTNIQNYIEVAKSKIVLKKTISELQLEFSIDDLKNIVSTSSDKDTEYFSIRITAGTPLEAQRLLQTLTAFFIEELNMIYKEKAVEQFILNFNEQEQIIEEQMIILSQNLEKTENMLLPQKPLLSEGVINPVYQMLQTEIFAIKLQLEKFEITDTRNKMMLSELEVEKENILAYYKEDDTTAVKDDVLNIIKSRVRIDKEPLLPEKPVAPRKMVIFAIFITLGVLLSLLIALFKVFWKTN